MDREDLVASMVKRCLKFVAAVFVSIKLRLLIEIDTEEGQE